MELVGQLGFAAGGLERQVESADVVPVDPDVEVRRTVPPTPLQPEPAARHALDQRVAAATSLLDGAMQARHRGSLAQHVEALWQTTELSQTEPLAEAEVDDDSVTAVGRGSLAACSVAASSAASTARRMRRQTSASAPAAALRSSSPEA
ncbi:MAG TPA: hypothetical protein VE932_11575 [Patescibacteria group bacterium]|nr:hypothetical protein [Patescibacteria group bacterium]